MTRLLTAVALAVALAACAPAHDPDDDTRTSACTMLNGTLATANAEPDTTAVADVLDGIDNAGIVAAGMDDQTLMEAIADLSIAIEIADSDAAMDAAARVDTLCNQEN